MKLNKSEALLTRSLVFTILLKECCDEDLRESLEGLRARLDEFLLSSDTEHCEHSCGDEEEVQSTETTDEVDDDHDEDEDEDEDDDRSKVEFDELISPVTLHDLPSIDLTYNDDKLHLEFEDVDSIDSVDTLIDDDFKFETVGLKVEKGKLSLFTSNNEIHIYDFVRLPKKWSKTFEFGKMYGVGHEEE